MRMGLRKFTAREHVLVALVLVFVVTAIAVSVSSRDAALLRSAGHLTLALIVSLLPGFVLLMALLTLLPRTDNGSRHPFLRSIGKLPLLMRYLIIGLLFCGIETTIKILAS